MQAIVIGATGLVGSQLVELLLKDDRFTRVKVFHRRSIEKSHPKLEEHIINFDNPGSWAKSVKGDVLYSAMGTTLRKAGSKATQYKIDYTYQFQTASVAAKNDIPVYVLVSASMAKPDSKIFYSRMKGELERDVATLPFKNIHIIKPGLLTGNRKELRIGEEISASILKVASHIPGLKNWRPIPGNTVARAMINATFINDDKIQKYELGDVFDLSAKQ